MGEVAFSLTRITEGMVDQASPIGEVALSLAKFDAFFKIDIACLAKSF